MIPDDVRKVLVPIVIRFEGLRLKAYQDSVGVWTCGYGHTGPDVTKDLEWTQSQAEEALENDLQSAFAQLLLSVPAIAQESPGRQAAITDFVYNLGIGKFRNSTLRSAILVGAWESVKHQLSLWVHAGSKILPGLVARRAAEISLIDT